jgi:hypothetical protein
MGYGYGWTATRLFPSIRDQVSQFESCTGVVAFIVLVMSLVCLFYPCYFRYGFGKGFAAFLVALSTLATLACLAPGIGRTARNLAAPEFWRHPGPLLEKALGLGDSTSGWPLGSTLPVLLMVIWLVHVASLLLLLSVRFYRRRDF